jgi:hypothetical protein
MKELGSRLLAVCACLVLFIDIIFTAWAATTAGTAGVIRTMLGIVIGVVCLFIINWKDFTKSKKKWPVSPKRF